MSDHAFCDEAVLLDGKHFIDCSLENCELTYGGGVVILERTWISGCHYVFGGQAGRTVDLLKVLGLLTEAATSDMVMEELVH